MTDRTAYRQRVATVRGRARAQLAAIRKERLARMRTVPRTGDPLADAWLDDQLADVTAEPFLLAADAQLAPAAEADEAMPNADAPGFLAEEEAAREDGHLALPPPPADPPEAHPAEAASEPVPATAVVAGHPAAEDDAAPRTGRDMHAVSSALDAAAAMPPSGEEPRPAVPVLTALPEAPPDASAMISEPAHPAAGTGLEGAQSPEPGVPAPDPRSPRDVAPDSALPDDVAQDEPVDPLLAELAPAPASPGEGAGTAPAPSSEGPVAGDPGDLSEIPGVGPGLVWMLRTAGVSSLGDLARADARDLAGKLGPIARLLDLDYLIGFARIRTEAR